MQNLKPLTIQEQINDRPMGLSQWIIVAVSTLLMITEGYDIQAMAFTANAVSNELGLTPSQLGVALSAGLMGMALGTGIVGPFADRFGRKPLLIIFLAINIVGLLGTMSATNFGELFTWRLLTGVGIGGTMASGMVLISEYSNRRYRALALSIYSAGIPIGGTIGGLLTVPLISNFSWHYVFFVGAIISIIVWLLVLFVVPESLENLTIRNQRGNKKALSQAEGIARRLSLETPLILPEISQRDSRVASAYAELFSKKNRSTTVKMWTLYFLMMASYYFVSSWTPQLLVEIGLTAEQGIYLGMVIVGGGLVGNILYGVISSRFDPRRVMLVFAVTSSILMLAFGAATSTVLVVVVVLGLALGVVISGCMAALYTLAPLSYPAQLRSTGVGMAMTVGRIGSILAPLAVGGLLDLGWTPVLMYFVFAPLVLIPGVLAFFLPSLDRTVKKENEPEPERLKVDSGSQ